MAPETASDIGEGLHGELVSALRVTNYTRQFCAAISCYLSAHIDSDDVSVNLRTLEMQCIVRSK